MNETTPVTHNIQQQFADILTMIERQQSAASQAVNEKHLLTAWAVGGYVSAKLKSEEWGSKVVTQLAEYIRTNAPDVNGFSRRNIYNMVMFYDEYSSPSFLATIKQYLPTLFVQTASAQLTKLLSLTSYSNHIEILCNCKSHEQRLFYILYSHRERLNYKELQRCIANDTFTSLLGGMGNLSKGLLQAYSPTMIAEYKRQLIPKEKMQQLLDEYCSFFTDGTKL